MTPFGPIWLALAALTATGCTSVKLPSHPFTKGGSDPYLGIESGYSSDLAVSEEVYHSVRRARAENGIVLQVVGDSSPSRVMPLPPAGKTVYLSQLLDETGVQESLGEIEATLYRHSSDSIGGIPMVVKMSQDQTRVRPECDYALQAGDRIRVEQAPDPGMQRMVNALFGL
jgi:hypothetical protein